MEKIKEAIITMMIFLVPIVIVTSLYLIIKVSDGVRYQFDTDYVMALKGDHMELCWSTNKVLINGEVTTERHCVP